MGHPGPGIEIDLVHLVRNRFLELLVGMAEQDVIVFAGAGNLAFADGQGTDARFNGIGSMAADAAGNLYIPDYGNNAIRKVTPDGKVTTIAGTGEQGYADGEGNHAKFNGPSAIVVDKNGVIYVAEAGNNRIRKIEYK